MILVTDILFVGLIVWYLSVVISVLAHQAVVKEKERKKDRKKKTRTEALHPKHIYRGFDSHIYFTGSGWHHLFIPLHYYTVKIYLSNPEHKQTERYDLTWPSFLKPSFH